MKGFPRVLKNENYREGQTGKQNAARICSKVWREQVSAKVHIFFLESGKRYLQVRLHDRSCQEGTTAKQDTRRVEIRKRKRSVSIGITGETRREVYNLSEK